MPRSVGSPSSSGWILAPRPAPNVSPPAVNASLPQLPVRGQPHGRPRSVARGPHPAKWSAITAGIARRPLTSRRRRPAHPYRDPTGLSEAPYARSPTHRPLLLWAAAPAPAVSGHLCAGEACVVIAAIAAVSGPTLLERPIPAVLTLLAAAGLSLLLGRRGRRRQPTWARGCSMCPRSIFETYPPASCRERQRGRPESCRGGAVRGVRDGRSLRLFPASARPGRLQQASSRLGWTLMVPLLMIALRHPEPFLVPLSFILGGTVDH